MQAEYLVTMANDIAVFFESVHLVTAEGVTAADSVPTESGPYRGGAAAVEREGLQHPLAPAVYLAASGAAAHIKNYWDPRMRSAIIEIWRAGGSELSVLAGFAVRVLANMPAKAK